MEVDHATLMSFELPDYTQELSMDESLPLRAAAAEPAPVEPTTLLPAPAQLAKNANH